MKFGFRVEVVEGLATDFATEVLMIKYTPRSSGFEARLRGELKKRGDSRIYDAKLEPGEHLLVESPPDFPNRYILAVGTVNVFDLGYAAIRQLGYDMLASLHAEGLDFRHVTTTLHGVNTALKNDVVEAFRSLLLGFADAYSVERVPPNLESLTIIERESYRAKLLQETLEKFLPSRPASEAKGGESPAEMPQMIAGIESFDVAYQQPVAADDAPHIFVAMPFSDEYDDHYYLAIRPAITENKLFCIRLDQEESVFTGDIMEQVKERIRSAQVVIALLDGRNPNVYLEVGYAWGVGTPTILVLHQSEDPPFDVQGARLIHYKQMYRLKDQLTQEIKNLLKL